MLPEKVASILSDSLVRERVLLQCDASDVLRVAFSQTEADMNNYYEVFPLAFLVLFVSTDCDFLKS
jgi:protein phosphatase